MGFQYMLNVLKKIIPHSCQITYVKQFLPWSNILPFMRSIVKIGANGAWQCQVTTEIIA